MKEINKLREWVERFKAYFNTQLEEAILRGESQLVIKTYYPYLQDAEEGSELHFHKVFKDFLREMDYNIIEEESDENKITISWE